MHGFYQGNVFLSEACSEGICDVFFLQEHWQTNSNIQRLSNINVNYVMYGEPAMSSETSKGIIFGRPFGGIAVLVKSSLVSHTLCVLQTDRLVALRISGFLFINMYLPCEDCAESSELLIEILSEASFVMNDCDHDYCILGGDMNTDLNSNRKHAKLINTFLLDHNIQYCQLNNSCSSVHTFGNEKRNSYSLIDFLCVSNDLAKCIASYEIVDNAFNFSDHQPVKLSLNLPMDNALFKNLYHDTVDTNKCNQGNLGLSKDVFHSAGRLRFDHGNIAAYYEYSRLLLEPILSSMNGYYNNVTVDFCHSPEQSHALIESWYNGIVMALIQAASEFIPRIEKDELKFWWDAEMDSLKNQSICSHKLWIEAGKPRDGIIYRNRTQDKFRYKNSINQRKNK